MALYSRKNPGVGWLSGIAMGALVTFVLPLGGVAQAGELAVGEAPDSAGVQYSAKERYGSNWDGWELVIKNDTGLQLNFVEADPWSGNNEHSYGVRTSVPSIAPGDSATLKGYKGWLFGYYPLDMVVYYTATHPDTGVVDTYRMGLYTYLSNWDLSSSCYTRPLHSTRPSCEFTSLNQTEQIQVRLGHERHPWLR